MTSMIRNVQSDSVKSPMLRSAVTASRTAGGKLGQHSDAVFIVLATVAFVIVVGLLGVAML
jgi:hypothetical protein